MLRELVNLIISFDAGLVAYMTVGSVRYRRFVPAAAFFSFFVVGGGCFLLLHLLV